MNTTMSQNDKEERTDILGTLRKREAELVGELELVRKQIGEWESAARRVAGRFATDSSFGPTVERDDFSLMEPHKAILKYMNKAHVKAPTRQQIIDAVIYGGARLGVNKAKSVMQAITVLVDQEQLKEPSRTDRDKRPDPNSKIGLPEWGEEYFQ